MDPLSDPRTVEGYWRPLTEQEILVTVNLIMVASAVIRRRLPNIDAWLTDGTADRSIVEYVITEMIKQAVESGNRDVGIRQESEGIGPYNKAVTYDAAQRIGLSDDLLGLIVPVVKARPKLGTIRLSPALAPWPVGRYTACGCRSICTCAGIR